MELGDVVTRHRREGETFLNSEFFHAFLARTGWLFRLLSEVEEALGRIAWGDGIDWTTWELLAKTVGGFAHGGRSGRRSGSPRARGSPLGYCLDGLSSEAGGAFHHFCFWSKLCRSSEQEWRHTPPMPPQWAREMMERAFAQRGRQIFAKACPKSGPVSRNDWISEETWSALRAHGQLRSIFFRDVRRRQTLLMKCVQARWRGSKDVEADAWKVPNDRDRSCRADDALGRSIRLQMFAFRMPD